MTRVRLAAALLAAAVVATTVVSAGAAGVLYLVVFALALAPGLPLGWRLFGRTWPGWIAGGLLGYFLTAIVIWGAIAAHVPSALVICAGWIVLCAVVWLIARSPQPALVALPSCGGRDLTALLLLLLIVPAIMAPPFARVGSRDEDGNRRYHAYFTADFVWHLSLTAEIGKFAMPPRNPYLADQPIHYYWTYFLLPAAVAADGPAPLRNVERCVTVNAIGTALLFVSAIFLAAWLAVPRPRAVAIAVALAIAASSAEGAYAIVHFWRHGVPLGNLRNLNVDALSDWDFSGLRIDGLQRVLWWVPQHAMAYALGLSALGMTTAAGSGASIGAIAIAGLALAGSLACSPLVGGLFALAWGGAAVVDALGSGAFFRRVVRHALAVLPVAAVAGWCVANQMFEGASTSLQFGWYGAARVAPVRTFLLSLGPAVLPAMAGWLPARDLPIRRLTAPILLFAGSVVLMYAVRLRADTSWVAFRAGQLILIAIPALTARGLVALHQRRRALGPALVCAALVAGVPTLAIDEFNAQDVENQSWAQNFPWTISITADEWHALNWLRQRTPADAVVQMEPIDRGRETWTLVPWLAQRRMAAGLPISLINFPIYLERSRRVQRMYATTDAHEAWTIARSLRIQYVYVDRVERSGYPRGMPKFGDRDDFVPVYRNSEVTIYRVE
ncbi:MAG TPA: hypothetical protein VFX12_12950 [Vicinamibacterales bacterium]|nr:hypothetical protein [Vicinamibacterales bacterium]